MTELPAKVQRMLRAASREVKAQRAFSCKIFGAEWNAFVEHWAPLIYDFVGHAMGPYGTEPQPVITLMEDAHHSAGATASFDPVGGHIQLASVVEGLPGQTLEKMTHEMTHGSLAQFPEGDPFYEEGFVDYSVWVMAHAPVWGEYREAMIQATAYNIAQRRDRAMRNSNDYDRKRWAGGMYAMIQHGPWIVSNFKCKKLQGDYTW